MNIKNCTHKFVLLVALSAAMTLVAAANGGGGDSKEQGAAVERVMADRQAVKLNSDRGDYNEQEKLVRLIGNVKFTYGDVVMTSSFAQYHTDTQIADFQGNVKLEQPGTVVTGKSLRVYYGQKKAIFKDGAQIVSHKFAGAGASGLNSEHPDGIPAYLEAQSFEYDWDKGQGRASGKIRFRQGERRIYADAANYDSIANKVELSGNVRFENNAEDWLSSERVCVDLTTNAVEATGQVVGRFLIDNASGEEKAGDSLDKKADLPEPEVMEPDLPPDLQMVERIETVKYPDL